MDNNHLIIQINVKTGLQDNYLKFEDGQIILGIKSLPLKNKANLEVIKILSKLFRVDDIDIIIIPNKTPIDNPITNTNSFVIFFPLNTINYI